MTCEKGGPLFALSNSARFSLYGPEDDQHRRARVGDFVMWVARIDEGHPATQEPDFNAGLVVNVEMKPNAVGGRVEE